jgi:hypothetical protein
MKIETKFDIGQELYSCSRYINYIISKITIEKIRIVKSKNEEENINVYSGTDEDGYAVSCVEEQLFKTKEEAEEYKKTLLIGLGAND